MFKYFSKSFLILLGRRRNVQSKDITIADATCNISAAVDRQNIRQLTTLPTQIWTKTQWFRFTFIRVTVHLQHVFARAERKRMLIHSIERRYSTASWTLIDTFAFFLSSTFLLRDKSIRLLHYSSHQRKFKHRNIFKHRNDKIITRIWQLL